MAERDAKAQASLVAELNDLLQLDHDAVQAYTIAIDHLPDPEQRQALERFRADHERHIQELAELIRAHGGIPLELPHIPTGFFKSALQRAGTLGGSAATILAFKANERQVRDKYRLAAREQHPADVADVLTRAAADESRHYLWALEMLDQMRLGPETVVGRVEEVFERGQQGATELIERVERRALETVQQIRSGDFATLRADLEDQVRTRPVSTALIAVGVGILLGRMMR